MIPELDINNNFDCSKRNEMKKNVYNPSIKCRVEIRIKRRAKVILNCPNAILTTLNPKSVGRINQKK